jgi:hypothetical protein
MYDMNKYDACTFRMSSHPSRTLEFFMLGDGKHMLSHIGETISLLVCAVSVPVENCISAHNFPIKHTRKAVN